MKCQKIALFVLVLFGLTYKGNCLRCYECESSLGPTETGPCLTGDEFGLRRVRCLGPSVCAFYRYESHIPGTPSTTHVTRGCQSLRYGGTCEDIFNELRRTGGVLPGQHTCATCNTDLCNSAITLHGIFYFKLILFLSISLLSF